MKKSVSVIPKLDFDSVLKDPTGGKAFARLASGLQSSDELKLLVGLAVNSFSFPTQYDMLFVEGMTRRELAAFPALLLAVAAQIERIGDNPHLEPAEQMLIKAQELKNLLRDYSGWLSGSIETARRFMKRNPHYWNFRAIFVLKLIRYVNKKTGRPNYSAIADLLNAGLTAVGRHEFIGPDALRKLNARNPASRKPRI